MIKELVKVNDTERRIIELIAQGIPSKQIADVLNSSETSIETLRYRLFHKVGAKSAANLVSIAYQTGILKIEE